MKLIEKIIKYPEWQKKYVDGIKQLPIGVQILHLVVFVLTSCLGYHLIRVLS